MARETILHIGYDSVLTEVRNGVLARGGYSVLTVIGNAHAREIAHKSNPDLIVIGSGGDYDERLRMAEWLQGNMEGARILAMCTTPEERFPERVVHFCGDTPREWLLAVESVLATRPRLERKAHNGASR